MGRDEEEGIGFYPTEYGIAFTIWRTDAGEDRARLGFWNRLRYCWLVLRTGIPWTNDPVELSVEEVRSVARELLALTRVTR